PALALPAAFRLLAPRATLALLEEGLLAGRTLAARPRRLLRRRTVADVGIDESRALARHGAVADVVVKLRALRPQLVRLRAIADVVELVLLPVVPLAPGRLVHPRERHQLLRLLLLHLAEHAPLDVAGKRDAAEAHADEAAHH